MRVQAKAMQSDYQVARAVRCSAQKRGQRAERQPLFCYWTVNLTFATSCE